VSHCSLNRAHAEYRSVTLSLDATFLAMGLCNTKWILDTYGAVVTWIHGTCLSFQLLDFVNMDMNFQIPKRKCNWRDFRLSLDVFDVLDFYSELIVRFYRRFGTWILVNFQSTLSKKLSEDRRWEWITAERILLLKNDCFPWSYLI